MRFSIITVNLNNKAGLERTLRSVLEQTNCEFESIVIDGLSDDGSRDVIAACAGRIKKWVLEKDTGIFNAMNKGIQMAEGEYLLFLNSGDYLYSADTLDKVFRHQFTEDFVVYDIELVKREGREVHRLEKAPREVLILGEIYHQSVFHHRRVFEKLGLYDESFKLAADYQLFLKGFFKARCPYRIIHEILCIYDHTDGRTSDPSNARALQAERRKAQKAVFDAELIDALEKQYRETGVLSGFKSLYEGLLQSGTIRTALWVSAVLRRIRRLFGLKTPR